MADDLFNSLKKKEGKKSLIESLIENDNVNEKEEQTKDNDIINADKEKKDDVLFDDIDTSLDTAKREIVFDEKEKTTNTSSSADDLLSGATGMRVLSFDDDEEEEQDVEETNEKMIKISAMTADDIKKIEYVVYLLSSRNFDEAIEYIEKWRNE